MNPFFFGDSHQQLFGAYHPARGRSNRGAVICYPWAREYLLAHSALKLLSQRLADSGWHSLRFDYSCTGDSAGNSTDATQRQWLADIEMAIDELKDIAQVKEVSLIGMRLGATLAALVADRRPDVGRVVLWDPVTDGRSYLSELGVPKANGRISGEVDVQGAVLTGALRAELEGITPGVFGSSHPRTLIVSSEGTDAIESLVAQLRSAGVDCSVEIVSSAPVWREEWGRHGKGLPVDAINKIISWSN